MPKRIIPILFPVMLLLCVPPSALCAEQTGALSRFSTRLHAARATNDREQDGLVGPVRRVKTETAKITVKSGKPVEGPRTVLETITYDNKGARIDSAYFLTAGGTLTGKEVYKYDERGNMVEMTLHDVDGSLLAKETYSYEFDAVGNWVKMTTAVAVVEGGKLAFEPTEVTYRSIAYFLEEKTAAKLSQPVALTTAQPASPAAATLASVTPAQTSPAAAAPTQHAAATTAQPAASQPVVKQTPPQSAASQPASSQPAPSSQAAAPAGAGQQSALKPINKPAEPTTAKPLEKPVEKAAGKPSDNGASVPQQVAALSPERGAAAARQPMAPAPNSNQPNSPTEAATKTEAAVKPEAAKTEAGAKPEAIKPEAAKPEAARMEVAKAEASKPDAAKTEGELAAKPEGESAARPVVRGPLKPVSGGILNGKAISLPAPQYPDMARRAAVSGIVEVEVVIDVSGKVISAKASKGPVMLQQAAEHAARLAKFVPTLLSGQPVKVSGTITYNFALR